MNEIFISDFSFGILASQVIIGLFSILAIYFYRSFTLEIKQVFKLSKQTNRIPK